MTEHSHLSDRDRVLLLGLADGGLSERRRAEAEARLQALPDGAQLLERQQRVRRALREGPAPVMPTTLSVTAPARRWRWAPQAGFAGALAAVLLALVLVMSPGGPSVADQAAALAHSPATAPTPASSGTVLDASVEGVAFPDWSGEFGWNERGLRHDTLDGRSTTTVFYEHMGHRIAYTILSGVPVAAPAGSRVVRRNGVEIALVRDGDHTIAVFERDGRTCVLAGHVERVSTMVKLAAWTA